MPGEIVKGERVETSEGDAKVPVSIEKPKSSVCATKKVTKKIDKLRREKAKKLALIKGKEIMEVDPLQKYTKSAGKATKKNKWQIQENKKIKKY